MFANRSRILATLVTLIVFCTAIDVRATVVVANRDTHVTTAAPSTAFGASETLQVSAQATTFLWHDVAAVLPAGTRPGDVVKATLHLWISKQSPNPRGAFRVVPVQTSWVGASMTYLSGRPVYPLTSAVTHTLGGAANHYFVVDVTDIVKNWVTAPATNNVSASHSRAFKRATARVERSANSSRQRPKALASFAPTSAAAR